MGFIVDFCNNCYEPWAARDPTDREHARATIEDGIRSEGNFNVIVGSLQVGLSVYDPVV